MMSVLRVTDVQPLDGYRLRVVFNDGVVRDVDCSFLLRGTLGEPLRDPDYFRRARVDDEARTVVWPNGLDPAPELLYETGAASATAHSLAHRAHA
jgi:Protein of unknown function (DUF2442)